MNIQKDHAGMHYYYYISLKVRFTKNIEFVYPAMLLAFIKAHFWDLYPFDFCLFLNTLNKV